MTYSAEHKIRQEESKKFKPAFGGKETGDTPFFPKVNIPVQTKLTISQPGDKYEQEADAMAKKVLTKRDYPEGFVSDEDQMYQSPIQMKSTGKTEYASEDIQRSLEKNSGGGSEMSQTTRSEMESSFGQDFGGVRVHTGSEAHQMNHDLSAEAFTHGKDIYFKAGNYQPESPKGKELLAHELTHVVQQTGGDFSAAEKPMISRFSDTGHHQIEEYALHNAGLGAGDIAFISQADTPEKQEDAAKRYGLTKEQILLIQQSGKTGELRFNAGQIKGIHKGNTQRDYSQVPKAGNAFLLNQNSNFGGYKAEEHFDNFIYDIQSGKWRTRGVNTKFKYNDLRHPDTSPLDYIRSQIYKLAEDYDQKESTDEHKMIYAGNAFHTVEDFFAHSNFVELIQSDSRHGNELISGSVGGTSDSIYTISESISGAGMKDYFHQQAEAVKEKSAEGSHAKMAKDHPGAHNFEIARKLAALVVRQLSTDLLISLLATTPAERKTMLENTFMKKLVRYFRKPDFSDRWWDAVLQKAPANIDSELDRIQNRTPVTINQSPFSPLRNIEASAYGPMKIPLGIALPIRTQNNHFWIQGGFGVMAPVERDDRFFPRILQEETPGFFGGIQIGGGF
ncbi:MAG: DUF4157 domain-containing protein [Bacteroidia bacterium]